MAPPPSSPPRRTSTLLTTYLLGYNLLCALLWTAVLGRVVLLVPLVGFRNVYGGVGDFTRWTQTLALLEVFHSALGLTRSPLPTTLIQVSSRLLLVHPVLCPTPLLTPSTALPSPYPPRTTPFYASMLLAWSVTEVIRYSYFVFALQQQKPPPTPSNGNGNGKSSSGRGVPPFMTWLRYNTFFVLYPVGIASEMACIWLASRAVGRWGLALWGVLAVYVPGSYVMYSHMMRQRRKVLRGKQPERKAVQ